MLKEEAPTFRTWRNQNARTGVALNVLRVRPWHRFAVLEVEAASTGAMDWPARVVAPDMAVMICVASTHTTAYEDLDAHAREKVKLVHKVSRTGTLILNGDDSRVAAMGDGFSGRVLYFSAGNSILPCAGQDAALTGEPRAQAWPERLSIEVSSTSPLPETRLHLQTQLVGTHWVHAVLAAFTAALALGLDPHRAAQSLAATPPFPGRLQPVRTPNGAVFLRDDYNASVPVLDASLEVLRHARAQRRVLVLTDFSDFGGNRRQRLKFLGSRLKECAESLVLVGRDATFGTRRAVAAGLSPNQVHSFKTMQEAAAFLQAHTGAGDLVLVKGRTTDHAARLVLSQFTPISCWKEYCPKRMLCDICWELNPAQPKLLRIQPQEPELSVSPEC